MPFNRSCSAREGFIVSGPQCKLLPLFPSARSELEGCLASPFLHPFRDDGSQMMYNFYQRFPRLLRKEGRSRSLHLAHDLGRNLAQLPGFPSVPGSLLCSRCSRSLCRPIESRTRCTTGCGAEGLGVGMAVAES